MMARAISLRPGTDKADQPDNLTLPQGQGHIAQGGVGQARHLQRHCRIAG